MPLRPELYKRLKARFRHVEIASAGERMVSHYEKDAEGRQHVVVDSYGESYRICCPWCQDTRKRCWVRHMWGKLDLTTKSDNLWMIKCYNDRGDCWDYERQKSFYSELFSVIGSENNDPVSIGRQVIVSRDVVWPGELRLLTQLDDEHPAKCYIRQRGYDPLELANLYNVSVCIDALPEFRMAQGRIVIPVYMQGKPVGWQSRYVGTPPSKQTPKYYSMKGWKKEQCLYNYDLAKQFSFTAVFEGPTKAWRFGPEGTCTFGKKMATRQAELLRAWTHVVVVSDATVDVTEQDVQGNLDLIKQVSPQVTVMSLRPLPGVDPGDIPREDLRSWVYTAVQAAWPQLGVAGARPSPADTASASVLSTNIHRDAPSWAGLCGPSASAGR